MQRKRFGLVALASIAVALGCGGGDSREPVTALSPNSDFQASLPGGQIMNLHLDDVADGLIDGNFEAGDSDDDAGVLEGEYHGTTISADCAEIGGAMFTLSGQIAADGSLDLIRSDMPGVALHFNLMPKTPVSRAVNLFRIQTTDDSSTFEREQAEVYTPGTPAGDSTRYVGSWRGFNMTMYEKANQMDIFITLPNRTEMAAVFDGLKVSALGNQTVDSRVANLFLQFNGKELQPQIKRVRVKAP